MALELNRMEHSTRQPTRSTNSYRKVWFTLWIAMFLVIPLGVVFGTTTAVITFFIAFSAGVTAVFWRCPNCGRHVGIKRYGIFLLNVPGVRRCVHCSTLLVTLRP
jgi:hypothetical protein